jgi:hypothetical protein
MELLDVSAYRSCLRLHFTTTLEKIISIIGMIQAITLLIKINHLLNLYK